MFWEGFFGSSKAKSKTMVLYVIMRLEFEQIAL
jgi:hypothetical protein